MSRKNIYDLLEEKEFNPAKEFSRLAYRFSSMKLELYSNDGYNIYPCDMTILEHGNEIINLLPIHSTCFNIQDLLEELEVNLNSKKATFDDILTLAELILCIIDNDPNNDNNAYKFIIQSIETILSRTSHKIILASKGRIIVPNDTKTEQAASLAKNNEVSLEILQYNHRSNLNNLKTKREILNKIGFIYEKELKASNSSISDDIRFLLNNLQIRHNNKENNSAILEKINGDLEQWYDKLYSLFIAFVIEQDKDKIHDEVKKIKKSLN